MGLLQQKHQEQKRDWAGLPSAPLDPQNPAEALAEAPSVEPFVVTQWQTTSMVFPVVAPAPEAEDTTTSEPGA